MKTFTKVSEFTVNVGPEQFLITVEPITTSGGSLEDAEEIAKIIASIPAFVKALKTAEDFMAGFRDDELQDGINDKLAEIADAIEVAEMIS